MATASELLANGNMLLRILAYGPAKSKKTWWALNAAQAGFNVILLDGDDGWQIASQQPAAALERISIWQIKDQMKTPMFAPVLARLLKNSNIVWDESVHKLESLRPNENCVKLDLDKLDSNCILVMDSWTALVNSMIMQFARENSIDLTEADKNEWEFYGWAGRLTTWMLNKLKSLKCHVIVVAHSTVYEKKTGKGKSAKTEWARRQPISTSGPAAMQMADKFSDVLFFHVHGSAFKIDTSGADDKDGGSRVIPPKDYQWNELQFVDICKAAGIRLPGSDNPFLDFAITAPATLQTKSPGVIQAKAATIEVAVDEKPKIAQVLHKPIKLGIKL